MILPSLPTTRLIRSSSLAIRSLSSMTSLKVSATFPARPVQSSGKPDGEVPLLQGGQGHQQSRGVEALGGRLLQCRHIILPEDAKQPATRGPPSPSCCPGASGRRPAIQGELPGSRSIRHLRGERVRDGHHVPSGIPVRRCRVSRGGPDRTGRTVPRRSRASHHSFSENGFPDPGTCGQEITWRSPIDATLERTDHIFDACSDACDRTAPSIPIRRDFAQSDDSRSPSGSLASMNS